MKRTSTRAPAAFIRTSRCQIRARARSRHRRADRRRSRCPRPLDLPQRPLVPPPQAHPCCWPRARSQRRAPGRARLRARAERPGLRRSAHALKLPAHPCRLCAQAWTSTDSATKKERREQAAAFAPDGARARPRRELASRRCGQPWRRRLVRNTAKPEPKLLDSPAPSSSPSLYMVQDSV